MRKILCFTVAILVAGSTFAAGEIWRWKDANGTWHYADQPQPGAELVSRGGRTTTDRTTAPMPPAPPPPPSPPQQTQLTTSEGGLPVSDDVAAQVRQEVAVIKGAQCKKAEEYYQGALKARTITRLDEKGNKVYLTDAEIDATRLEARSARDRACGPGA